MNFVSAKASNAFGVIKGVFVNISIALEILMMFIKSATFLSKITGDLKNVYQLLFYIPLFLVNTTKIYIKGVYLDYYFNDSS